MVRSRCAITTRDERRLAGLGDGFAQHGVDVLAGVAVGREVIGGIIVDRVDRRGVDELLDRHHLRAVDFDAVEVVVAQQQIFALAEFIAFDERAALQFLPGLAVLRDHADAVAGLGIDEIEPDSGPVVAGVVEGHGAGHEGEAQVATPDGSCGHQAARSGRQDRPVSPRASASALSSSAALASAAS